MEQEENERCAQSSCSNRSRDSSRAAVVRCGYGTLPVISSNRAHQIGQSQVAAAGSLPSGMRLPMENRPLPYAQADFESDLAASRTGKFFQFGTKNRADGHVTSQEVNNDKPSPSAKGSLPSISRQVEACGSSRNPFALFWQRLTRKTDTDCSAGIDEKSESESSCLGGRLKRNAKSTSVAKHADTTRDLPVAAASNIDIVGASGNTFDQQDAANNTDDHTSINEERILSREDVFQPATSEPESSAPERLRSSVSNAGAAAVRCRPPITLPSTDMTGCEALPPAAIARRGPYPRVQCGMVSSSSSNSLASFGATGAAALSVTGVTVSQLTTAVPTPPAQTSQTLTSLVQTLDQGRLISTTVFPDSAVSGSDVLVTPTGTEAADGVPALIPRTVHTQIDYMHCLVPELPRIAACAYYWGVIDRYEAERVLEGRPEGTFLLRDSAQDDFLFSVSFRRYGRSLHARVEQWNHRFSFDAHDATVFSSPSVCALVEHYKDPASCLFFEPLLTAPLPRTSPFSLQALSRTAICGATTYDGIAALPLPSTLKIYLQHYHYKHRVRVRRFEAPPPPPARTGAPLGSAGAPLGSAGAPLGSAGAPLEGAGAPL